MRSLTVRLLSVVAVATPVVLGTSALPMSSAGAVTPPPRTTCRSLVGTSAAPTAKLGQCTVATTGGAGVIAGVSTNTDLVTWKSGGTTTFTFTHVRLTADACPTGSFEYRWTGKVTGGTGAATAVTGKVAALVCVTDNAKQRATLLAGTAWSF